MMSHAESAIPALCLFDTQNTHTHKKKKKKCQATNTPWWELLSLYVLSIKAWGFRCFPVVSCWWKGLLYPIPSTLTKRQCYPYGSIIVRTFNLITLTTWIKRSMIINFPAISYSVVKKVSLRTLQINYPAATNLPFPGHPEVLWTRIYSKERFAFFKSEVKQNLVPQFKVLEAPGQTAWQAAEAEQPCTVLPELWLPLGGIGTINNPSWWRVPQ